MLHAIYRRMRILITDGNERAALAAARSLVHSGHEVHVVAAVRPSLAGASRGTRSHCAPHDPLRDPVAYAADVASLAQLEGIELLLPITDASAEALLEHRGMLPRGVALPFPDLAIYRAASDKAHILGLAWAAGFAVPETRVLAAPEDVDMLPDALFPAVVKPHRSVVDDGRARTKLAVTPVADGTACRRALASLPLTAYPVLVQRHVKGVGEGFFALRWNGRMVAMFAHRRLREKPPSGGVSVYRESIALDPQLAGAGARLLEALDWQGVAMVECKRDPGGRYVIMEVNGRFWGSLQLAIDAGVDFPALLARCVAGEPVPRCAGYRVGVRSRWLWGDVDHLYLRLTRSAERLQLEPGAPSRVCAVLDFLRVDFARDRSEVWRWRDPAPFLVESLQWCGLLGRGRRPSAPGVIDRPLRGRRPRSRGRQEASREGRVVAARPEDSPHREAGRPA
jgi:predicted ATP-grasp superfamily ATP-dependent carboligase